MIEFAHIKPVSKIKDECISQKFNKDILRQIKDKNNILPLNPDTHTLFDKKEIC
ncbi:HNH endonuclease [bacterium]|nr:HNH endonuclease [bacterium]